MKSQEIVVYHNPACGTSRNVLAALDQSGIKPTVVEYLKAGWTRGVLTDLLARMGAGPRAILRTRGTQAEALGLTDPAASDDAILDAMIADPILVERPIVATPRGVTVARPAEKAFDVLDERPESFVKTDGTVVRVR